MTRDEMIEKLAAIEHERWAGWQHYMHDQGRRTADNGLVFPGIRVEAWERQLATPYAGLSPREQLMDIEQVHRYWPLVVEHAAQWIAANCGGSAGEGAELAAVWRAEMSL